MNISFEPGLRALVLGSVIAACSSNNQRPPESASAMAETRAEEEGGSAVESIAEARCARESRCDNVGPDERYSSMEDCVIRVREDWREDLDARSCPTGVDHEQLNECLNEIRAEECSNPFDTLERVAACTASQICDD